MLAGREHHHQHPVLGILDGRKHAEAKTKRVRIGGTENDTAAEMGLDAMVIGIGRGEAGKNTRVLFDSVVVSESPEVIDVADSVSDSSDDLSYDASQVMGLLGADSPAPQEPDEHKQLPRQLTSLILPTWARPPKVVHASVKSIDAWHQQKGRTRNPREHGEALSAILNTVLPSNPAELPATPQWPLLATGPSKGKHRWVNKLCKTVSTQRKPHSTSIEAVCLARELRAPKKQVTRDCAHPQQRRWEPPQSGYTQHVQLPRLQVKARKTDSNVICHHFQEALAPSGSARVSATPGRHKFLQLQPGWQPWRTHRSRAFDS